MALTCGPASVEDDSRFDVVIFVLDACRADRIGSYGYERPTTPAIDALAADPDSVVYSRSYAAANWTKPTVASLFTGLYPYGHGVTDRDFDLGIARPGVEGTLFKTQVLAPGFETLAESFREAGYVTLALVTSYHLVPEYGFDQGFDEYYDPSNLAVGDVGRVSKLLDRVWGLESGYFAYVHQNACHYPFPEADRDSDFMDEFGFEFPEESRAEAGVDFTTSAIKDSIRKEGLGLTAEDVRFLSLVYDAKLRKVDREVVAPVIEGLRRAGRWDRTLFILTADHGEELYEHRGYGHSVALWDEVVRVPLIVKFPKGTVPPGLPRRVGVPTSTVDLYPSLMGFLGRRPPEGLAGRSIFDSPEGGFVLAQGRPDWAVVEGSDKLIMNTSGKRWLFDLDADPGETRNLAESRPVRVAELARLGSPAGTPAYGPGAPVVETELSPEAVETLRSLGYLD